MEDYEKTEDQGSADGELPAELEVSATDSQAPMTPEALAELRDRRNLEYFSAVLHKENVLAAAVGAVNGDLLNFANQMQRCIVPGLRDLPSEPGSLAQVVPAVEAYGRVARQVERFSALLERIERSQGAASKASGELAALERSSVAEAT